MYTHHDNVRGHKQALVPVFFAIAVAIICTSVLSSCSLMAASPSPASPTSSQIVEPYDPTEDIEAIRKGIARELDPLKTPTPETVTQFLEGTDQEKLAQLESTNGFDVRQMLVHLLRGFDYRVDGVSAYKDVATAELHMDCLDGAKAIERAQAQVVSGDEVALLGELYGTGDDGDWRKLIERLAEIVYDNLDSSQDMVSRDLTIHLSKQGGAWQVDPEDMTAILGAITAGMS